jgi:uncharacterized protein GlcG (DUF336 family)
VALAPDRSRAPFRPLPWFRSRLAPVGRRCEPLNRNAIRAVVALTPLLAALFAGGAEAANELPRRESLSVAEVTRIVRQAVAEALVRDAPAVIVVTDRVGNVLAAYNMTGAPATIDIRAGRPKELPNGLVGVPPDLIPAGAAAIAKAITAAYLSSNGNAFGPRTASQIIQENFNPGTQLLEGGPLFGVQFSSLPCSDLNVRFESDNGGLIDPNIGPKRSPLGLAGDPGGLPLYENGTLVGAIGVEADGVYRIDIDVRGEDRDIDELIAVGGIQGFVFPEDIRAERVSVDGRSLRLSDADIGDLESEPGDFRNVVLADEGAFGPVRGYTDGTVVAGQAFGFGTSGYRPDRDGLFNNPRAYVLTTPNGANRFPPIDGVGPQALTAREVTQILRESLRVAIQGRALIRRPLDSHIEVTISVVDVEGNIVGIARTPDGPVFGTDVSLQKARTSLLLTRRDAPALLRSAENQAGRDLGIGRQPGSYVNDMFDFIGPQALGAGIAYSTRAIGSIARPFYPDGRNGGPNGPLSVPIENFSPFYTGLQLDLILDDLVQHVGFVLGANPDVPPACTDIPLLADGPQIFSGGYPIYRGNRLIGAIGISGDGIDQDSMVAFLGVDRAGRKLDTGVGNAPFPLRADTLGPLGIQLKYVSCPYAPFIGSDQQNVCQER